MKTKVVKMKAKKQKRKSVKALVKAVKKVAKRQKVPRPRMRFMAADSSAPLKQLSGDVRLHASTEGSHRVRGCVLLGSLGIQNNSGTASPGRFESVLYQLFDTPGTSTGQALPRQQFLDLNPYSVGQFAARVGVTNRIPELANMYEKWSGSFALVWKPTCAVTQAGGFIVFRDPDPTDEEEDLLGSPDIQTRATDHGAVQHQYCEKMRLTFATKGKYWMRTASNADVRKTSAGHVLAFNADTLSVGDLGAGDVTPLGSWYLEYDLQFFTPVSQEIVNFAYYLSDETVVTQGNTGYFKWTDRSEPKTNTIVNYNNGLMAAPPALTYPAEAIMVLNHGCATPMSTFIEVKAYMIPLVPGTSSVAFIYHLGGKDVTSKYLVYDFNVESSTADVTVVCATIFIPPNTPPDQAQLVVSLSNTAATPTAAFGELWFTPSVLFAGDFTQTPYPPLGKSRTFRGHDAFAAKMKRLVVDEEKEDSVVVTPPSLKGFAADVREHFAQKTDIIGELVERKKASKKA